MNSHRPPAGTGGRVLHLLLPGQLLVLGLITLSVSLFGDGVHLVYGDCFLWGLTKALLTILAVCAGAQHLCGMRRPQGPRGFFYASPEDNVWYPLKKALMTLAVRRNAKKRAGVVHSAEGMEGLEQVHLEYVEAKEDGIDSYFVCGHNDDGTFFHLRLSPRPAGGMEIWLTVRLPGVGVLRLPLHPGAYVVQGEVRHAAEMRRVGGGGMRISGGGLTFECVKAMYWWRVSFDGELDLFPDEGSADLTKPARRVATRFDLRWNADTDPWCTDADIAPGTAAASVAAEEWSKEFFTKLKEGHTTHYEQFGQMKGTVAVDGITRRVAVRGMRDHSFGVRDWGKFRRYVITYAVLPNGRALTVMQVSLEHLSYVTGGVFFEANGQPHPIASVLPHMEAIGDAGPESLPNSFTTHFLANGAWHTLTLRCQRTFTYEPIGSHGGAVVFVRDALVTVDGCEGRGFSECAYGREHYPCLGPGLATPPEGTWTNPPVLSLSEEFVRERNKCVLDLEDAGSRDDRLAGGKGAQLGMLMQMAKYWPEPRLGSVGVPRGFIVSTVAWRKFAKHNTALASMLAAMEAHTQDVLAKPSQASHASIESVCDKIQRLILDAVMPGEITEAIGDRYEKMGGCVVAVRSSATDEDGCDSSAAGQMDTLLGMKGKEEIISAVRRCWASAFSARAVVYRIEAGLESNTTMAVVVQELVRSDTSGVAFTSHPVTGAREVVINAARGVGEAVVSGAVDPDTVVVTNTGDDFIVTSRGRGTKLKVYEYIDGTDGTASTGHLRVRESLENERADCLTDAEACRIARAAMHVEAAMSGGIATVARDIEWAVAGGRLYLLQARPITGLDTMESSTACTSEEPMIVPGTSMISEPSDAMTELDSAVKSCSLLTRFNIGEMFPGVACPLSIDCFGSVLDYATVSHIIHSGAATVYSPRYSALPVRCGHLLLDFTQSNLFRNAALYDKQAGEAAIFGLPLDCLSEEDLESYHGRRMPFVTRVLNCYRLYKAVQWGKMFCRTAARQRITYVGPTAADTLARIAAEREVLKKAWSAHVLNSIMSAVYSGIVRGVLSKNIKPEPPTVAADLGRLLAGSGEVLSAEVPNLVDKLASALIRAGTQAGEMAPEDLASILMSKDGDKKWGESRDVMSEIMTSHGHRCFREADLRTRSWRSDPLPLVKMVQLSVAASLAKGTDGDKADITLTDRLNDLKTPVTSFGKRILAWLVPKARMAVAAREEGKSAAVKMQDDVKEAYWTAAQQLVDAGRLPHVDLAFFLIHNELAELAAKDNPALVRVAVRRRRMFGRQHRLTIPELGRGLLLPIPASGVERKEQVAQSENNDDILRGFAVSVGCVRGPARVMTSIDSDTMLGGEILVCSYTDVSWSPYFTLASALVTEIGGLLSHGACVAREYGIACVVRVPEVTQRVRTGDIIEVDGDAGTVTIIERR